MRFQFFHSTYKKWHIWTPSAFGWWSATQVGNLPLKADTLSGLKQLISQEESA